jgi:hypothetical protein
MRHGKEVCRSRVAVLAMIADSGVLPHPAGRYRDAAASRLRFIDYSPSTKAQAESPP